MGHKLTHHGLPNTKGSSFNFKLSLFIEKNLAKNKIVSIINVQSMLSQNVERQLVNSTLQWLKPTS